MSQQARTYFDQARTFLRAGDAARGMDLLRRANLLCEHDVQLKIAILREMIGIAYATGHADRKPIWSEQLAAHEASLAPPPPPAGQGGAARTVTTARFGTGRRLVWIVVTAVFVLLVGLAGWHFAEQLRETTTPAPETAATSSQQQPQSQPIKLGTPRKSVASDFAARVRDNVGLLLWIQRFRGADQQGEITVEAILGSATAFAVDKSGIMLTCKHVTDLDPSDLPELADLTRVGVPVLKICFGTEPERHHAVEILHESPKYDMAIIRVEKVFAEPFELSNYQVADTESVLAIGYPAVVMDASAEANSAAYEAQLHEALRSKQCVYTDWLAEDAYKPVTTTGIIAGANRLHDQTLYHLFDAKIARGSSGGPLVLESSHEVIGIVTKGGIHLTEAQGYNFALALPQIVEEINRYRP